MSEKQQDDSLLTKKSSRRDFLKNSGITVGGLLIGGGITSLVTKEKNTEKNVIIETPTHSHTTEETKNYTEALNFFTRLEDFQTLSAATERIYPEDEFGPGAIALGVPFFIDKQLASPWGRNADDYMVRPFKNGESPLKRSEIMLQGIRKIDQVAQEKHGKLFKQLENDQMDAILQEFEAGNIPLELTTSSKFFSLLRTLTIEGCYCDPIHGGNKNMQGWIMAEFPGAIMSHADVVENDEFVVKKPQSLSDHIH